jgi:dolichol-phosphate mannosyltransferase
MSSLTVVVPVFNEAAALAETLRVLLAVLDTLQGVDASVLVVDDGSTDRSAEVGREVAARDRRVGLLCLGRNFGKESAIHAGLAHARGDAVVVMDADLQHPPALIPEMVRAWQGGAPVVEGVKRSRSVESLLARTATGLFYRLFGSLSELDIRDHTDFKLLDREVVDAYLALPERKRFFRGLIPWLGYPAATVQFDVPRRTSGRRTFGTLARLRLSLTAITSFSSLPLHLITLLGAVACAMGVVIGGIALRDKFTGRAVDGFTTVILIVLILGGLIMIGLGLVGVYLARIFDEVKARPHYVVAARRTVWPAAWRVPQDGPASRDQVATTAPSASTRAGSRTSASDTTDHPSGAR